MNELLQHKVRLTLNAMYRDGESLYLDHELVADCSLLATPSSGFRALVLRLIIPTRGAEDLAEALHSGDVELLIQDIPHMCDQ